MGRHLHTHGFKYIDPGERGNPPDIWDFWRKQVDEMNELCRLNGEPWAWEYLWKEWYCPRRWVLWARAASPNIYPIINSNASVEALWTTLKRFYLRRHPRASLERIWDLITNDFIRKRARQIHAIRTGQAEAAWYRGFRRDWSNAIIHIQQDNVSYAADLEQDGDYLLVAQQRNYHTNLDLWWCGCPAYRNSAYHVCKHLVRLFSDLPSSLECCRPIHGTVFRQSQPPLLWVKGLHPLDVLSEQPLHDPNARPSSPSSVPPDDDQGPSNLRLECSDTSDTEEAAQGDEEERVPDAEIRPDDEPAEFDDADTSLCDIGGGLGDGSELDYGAEEDGDLQPVERETELMPTALTEEGEMKLDAIRIQRDWLIANIKYCDYLLTLRPDDPYLHEVSPCGRSHIRAWDEMRLRWMALQRRTTLPRTFGPERSRNIFASLVERVPRSSQ